VALFTQNDMNDMEASGGIDIPPRAWRHQSFGGLSVSIDCWAVSLPPALLSWTRNAPSTLGQ